MSIADSLSYLFPGIDFLTECKLRDDGSGVYIEQWNRPEPQPTQQQIDDAALPAAKKIKLAEIRAAAKAHIYAIYPDWRQQSATLGIYDPAYVLSMQQFIASTIAASNTAEDRVDACTTVQQVDGVTATWP